MITIEPPSSTLTASLSKPSLIRFFNRARTLVGLIGPVDVLLTSDAELKRLNRAFRGKNQATDVLSFPAPPEIAEHHAGDLAISLDTAARQAAAFGHSLEVEVRVLLLHGLLHLSGEDHETDSGEMASLESEFRARLRLPVTLIDRVTNPSVTNSSVTDSRERAAKSAGKPAARVMQAATATALRKKPNKKARP